MFLALREIRHEPMRFGLIIAVIALVAYLTLFIACLAVGLAHSYRAAVDGWGAGSIVLTDASNESISASRLTDEQVATAQGLAQRSSAWAEPLTSVPAVAQAPDLKDEAGQPVRIDVFAFGIDTTGPLSPTITTGSGISDPDQQILVDHALASDGLAVGDTVTLLGSDHEWTVAGLTRATTFQAAPVITVDAEALRRHGPSSLSPAVSAVVLGSDLSGQAAATTSASQAELHILGTEQLIRTLPGYSAQVLTFSLMVGSLILIASLVLGIFLYVLTLHKRPILGIIKARGVPTSYLLAAGCAQTTILASSGVALGLAAVLLTSLVLPASVPFRFSPALDAGICAAFIAVSIIGGLVSVRVVARIDPVEAIA